jgi:CRP-like cAMP-binding protein
MAVKTFHLGDVPLFAGLSPDTLAPLVASCREVTVEKNDFLFRQGDRGKDMYIIQEGQLRIWKEGETGIEATLALLGLNEVVGELEIIDGRPRSAHAQATEFTRLVALPRDAFFNHLGQYPGMAVHMMTILSERLRRANEIHIQMHQEYNLTPRLSRLILMTAFDKSGALIKPRLRLEEIAYVLGVDVDTVKDTLAVWSERGLLQVDEDKWLIISDARALKALTSTKRLPEVTFDYD